MIVQKIISGKNLRKETFVTILKGMQAAEEFKIPEYVDYLKRLFRAVDNVVEMRKLAVTFMFMSTDKCIEYLKNFPFLHLDYNFKDLDLLKDLMDSIDQHPTGEFQENLVHGLERLNQGHPVSTLPYEPLWGKTDVIDEDAGSYDGDESDSGPEVKIGNETVKLDADHADDDSFHASVLKEKKFLDLMKSLKAKSMIDTHLLKHDGLPSDLKLVDSDLKGY